MKRKTKIVATIGPASNSPEIIEKLMLAGMDVARINFSHGTLEEHSKTILLIREISSRLGKHVGILADTKGPEIRTGDFENGSISYKRGQQIKIYREAMLGNKTGFHIPVAELYDDVSIGNYLLIDDGKMRLNIIEKRDEYLLVEVMNSGTIKNKKGVNVPGVHVSMPFISKKDSEDLAFAVKMNVDVIALSFVRGPNDLISVRSILDFLNGEDIELIAKIESQGAMDELEKILDVCDGIMVARGDLGVEVTNEVVPLYQKQMITKAIEKGRPVITATHMLESMMANPRPTRAETSDVANAILDGSDAIMLSGETAVGEYPVESVETMVAIAKAIEPAVDYDAILQKSFHNSQPTVNDAIGVSVSQIALTLPNVAAVIAFTETGGTPKRLCKFRPSVPIVAITNRPKTCTKLSYYWGVFSVFRKDYTDFLSYDRVGMEVAKELGYQPGDKIIITSGYAQQHGSTNTVRIIEVK
ncbi:MAG: pyruvate kinase [Acholeplasmataceae bacterium]|jgi:pyruvate kinase|nr:pyruvate kinase [Acholeplasmataceae bacterium]